MYLKLSKAREQLAKDKKFILWLFDNRCVRCGRPTNVIHEIIPISHGKVALNWKNRVTLCQFCHSWAHDIGTNISIQVLQVKRREFITRKFLLND